MSAVTVIAGLDPANYTRHSLHGEQCAWVEKNCYIDLWIELLHALKLEPLAMLPFTAAIDFEGDQWTFFKPSHDELRPGAHRVAAADRARRRASGRGQARLRRGRRLLAAGYRGH
jgi:hypothetical protein